MDIKIGQQVYGYISAPVVVCGTRYQEYGQVTRLSARRFKAERAGRNDGTGFQKEYSTMQEAMVAADLARHVQGGQVAEVVDGVLKLSTCFDVAQ